MLTEACLYTFTLLGGYVLDVFDWVGSHLANRTSLVVALALTLSCVIAWYMRAPYSHPNGGRSPMAPNLPPNEYQRSRGRCWSVAEKKEP
ncbi:unnamed protein product [Rhizoctonia solani]|uniref:Uncharacterized protein n=1 Tax=Rhizoctonia solani TaxID=456999 RepID=A0A8H3C4Y0_9AGAM|nr:unnamed protein product [Rhizoctonia solani]